MASNEHLPQQISEGVVEIMGLQVRVANLDNGQRVIHPDDFEALMQKAFGELNDILDLKAVARPSPP